MAERRREKLNSEYGAGPFFGRLLISVIFILAALGKIFDFSGTVQYMQSLGIQGASYFAVVAILFELIGGILILLGFYTPVGIWLLMIFLFPVLFLAHPFWNYSGFEGKMQLANFLKGVAIYGGLLLLLSYGPGRWSLDAWRAKNR